MALSVGVGLGVLNKLMAAEVEEVVGLKGRHDPERRASATATSALRSTWAPDGGGQPSADAKRRGRARDPPSRPSATSPLAMR